MQRCRAETPLNEPGPLQSPRDHVHCVVCEGKTLCATQWNMGMNWRPTVAWPKHRNIITLPLHRGTCAYFEALLS